LCDLNHRAPRSSGRCSWLEIWSAAAKGRLLRANHEQRAPPGRVEAGNSDWPGSDTSAQLETQCASGAARLTTAPCLRATLVRPTRLWTRHLAPDLGNSLPLLEAHDGRYGTVIIATRPNRGKRLPKRHRPWSTPAPVRPAGSRYCPETGAQLDVPAADRSNARTAASIPTPPGVGALTLSRSDVLPHTGPNSCQRALPTTAFSIRLAPGDVQVVSQHLAHQSLLGEQSLAFNWAHRRQTLRFPFSRQPPSARSSTISGRRSGGPIPGRATTLVWHC